MHVLVMLFNWYMYILCILKKMMNKIQQCCHCLRNTFYEILGDSCEFNYVYGTLTREFVIELAASKTAHL